MAQKWELPPIRCLPRDELFLRVRFSTSKPAPPRGFRHWAPKLTCFGARFAAGTSSGVLVFNVRLLTLLRRGAFRALRCVTRARPFARRFGCHSCAALRRCWCVLLGAALSARPAEGNGSAAELGCQEDARSTISAKTGAAKEARRSECRPCTNWGPRRSRASPACRFPISFVI